MCRQPPLSSPSAKLMIMALERISKKRTKNEAKTTKPDTEWKSMIKTKSRQSQRKLSTAGVAVNTVRPVNTANTKAVNTVRVKHTIARDRAVVSENMGKGANDVKASACWVWKAKNNSASTIFKKYSYIDSQGRSKSIMAWIPKRV
ncbi:hypothetical protein Tco_0024435 [Tanacetum coccineum]